MMRIRIAASTDPGARRGNEDDMRWGATPSGHYAVLADGAGGHSRGAEASRHAVECMERLLRDETMAFLPSNLSQVVRLAHSELQHHQDSERLEARMHTTVVALWIDAEARHALWTHVGDSRLYRIRQARCELLTEDDSVVQQMVRSGVLSIEQSRRHPQKNHLLAALGIEGEVEPHTVPRPVELNDGDVFLLCTDGWWDDFEPEDFAASLARAEAPEQWLAEMKAQIQARALPRQDNYSAITVWVGDPGEVTIGVSEDTIPRALMLR